MYTLLNNRKIYEKEEIDEQRAEYERELPEKIHEYASFDAVRVGTMMYWPVSKCVEREFHSDHPFKFTWRGQEYEVEPRDPIVRKLDIATDVPEGWHALDGTTSLLASEYPKLAEFIPANVDKDGKLWLPYVKKTIIKVKEVNR